VDVLQADSDARAAAARHAIMSFFISKILFILFLYNTNYAIGRSYAMGCNPMVRASRQRDAPLRAWNIIRAWTLAILFL
jgi:hypothetical protein